MKPALSPYPFRPDKYDGLDIWKIASYDEIKNDIRMLDDFTNGINTLFSAETFYNPQLVGLCKKKDIRSVLHINPEFAANAIFNPEVDPPDVVACPTRWLIDKIPNAVYLPMPVEIDRFPLREVTEIKRILHPIGHPAALDRSGSDIVYQTAAHMRSLTFVMRVQQKIHERAVPNVEHDVGVRENYWDGYSDVDAMMYPRRYGGLSLPMLEAASAGLPIISHSNDPLSELCIPELLVPSAPQQKFSIAKGGVEFYIWSSAAENYVQVIANLTRDKDLIVHASRHSRQKAEERSWEALMPLWKSVLFG